MNLLPWQIHEAKTGSYHSGAPTYEFAEDTCDRLFRTTGRYFVISLVKDYA